MRERDRERKKKEERRETKEIKNRNPTISTSYTVTVIFGAKKSRLQAQKLINFFFCFFLEII
jgi:hypothetical protein